MIKNLIKLFNLYYKNLFINKLTSTSDESGVFKYGYKEYVGGEYDKIGKALSYALINNLKLKKNDIFLDIGCGSLRVGKHIIEYLDKNRYLGLEPEKKLVEDAINFENINLEKNPQFVHNYFFDFKFKQTPNYVFANSVFTHLNGKDINLCFKKLDYFTNEDVVFFATFSTSPIKLFMPFKSHSHRSFNYTFKQIKEFGQKNNFLFHKYMGNEWGHPRNQNLFLFAKSEYIYNKYSS